MRQNNKKAMEMSWSFVGWMVLALVALIIIILIMKNLTGPGFTGVSILENR